MNHFQTLTLCTLVLALSTCENQQEENSNGSDRNSPDSIADIQQADRSCSDPIAVLSDTATTLHFTLQTDFFDCDSALLRCINGADTALYIFTGSHVHLDLSSTDYQSDIAEIRLEEHGSSHMVETSLLFRPVNGQIECVRMIDVLQEAYSIGPVDSLHTYYDYYTSRIDVSNPHQWVERVTVNRVDQNPENNDKNDNERVIKSERKVHTAVERFAPIEATDEKYVSNIRIVTPSLIADELRDINRTLPFAFDRFFLDGIWYKFEAPANEEEVFSCYPAYRLLRL